MIEAAMVAVIALGCAWVAVPARAAVNPDVTCTVRHHVTYSPGLTDTPRQTTISADHTYDPCQSSDPRLTSGRSHFQGTRQDSCSSRVSGTAGDDTITWNTGASSTFHFTRTATEQGGAGTVHLEGTITAGRFVGDHAVEDVRDANARPSDCGTSQGVTSESGDGRLTITP